MALTRMIFKVIMSLLATKKGFFRAICMTFKCVCLFLIFLILGCQQIPAAQTESPVNNQKQTIPVSAELDKQLKINKDAILQGPTEQMRMNAANIMLFDSNPDARSILIDILTRTQNKSAQAAVCKALKQTWQENTHEQIINKEQFVAPLLDIIKGQNTEVAELAAEATVIFDYQQISRPLEHMVSDTSLPVAARLNAIYALKLQKNVGAIITLINLLDDPEKQIADAAQRTIKDAGIPVVVEPNERQQLIEELKSRGKDEFLRNWLIRQEAEKRKLEAEVRQWQQMYLLSLDKIYSRLSDDASKVEFLSELLNGQISVVKLWALEKISLWRVGTSSKLPPQFGSLLLNLISDESRAVRLRTARLLSLMGQLSSAEKLLAQVYNETDEEVRTEMFLALGAACQYAYAPDSGMNMSQEIRIKTLEIASEYLFDSQTLKAQNGAEVIKRLLKQDGLADSLTEEYLYQLTQRYQQLSSENEDKTLKASLLNTMADLCTQGSPVATEARIQFAQLFEESLSDTADTVREAAVNGLINIDRTSALRKLRVNHINDPNPQIRRRIIDLAREVGSEADLEWLLKKLNSPEENQLAWPAMIAIFGRSEKDILIEWLERFNQEEKSLSTQQLLSFLEIVEKKIQTESAPTLVMEINEKMAALYTETANYELAAEYWGRMYQSAENSEKRQYYMGRLLDTYLESLNLQNATDLIHNYILEKDLEPNDSLVNTLDVFMNEPPAGGDPNVLLTEIEKLDIPEDRPNWLAQKEMWRNLLTSISEPNEPDDADS